MTTTLMLLAPMALWFATTTASTLAHPFGYVRWPHLGHGTGTTAAAKDGVTMQQRQKVLLDVLLQVEKPLVNAALVELGKTLNAEPAQYLQPEDVALRQFIARLHGADVLSHTAVYNAMDIGHARQLHGLYKMFVLARDWRTLVQNWCFARIHLNAVLMVQAVRLALRERDDTRQLVVPPLNEIVPQLFYDADVIRQAENVEWSDLVAGGQSEKIVDPSKVHALMAWLAPVRKAHLQKHSSSTDHIITPVPRTDETLLTSDVELNILWKDLMIARQMQAIEASGRVERAHRKGDLDGELVHVPLEPQPTTWGPIVPPLEAVCTHGSGAVFIQSLRQMSARIHMDSIASALESKKTVPEPSPVRETVRSCVRRLKPAIDQVIDQRQIDRSNSDAIAQTIGDLLTGQIRGMEHVLDEVLLEIVPQLSGVDVRHIGNIRGPVQQELVRQLVDIVEEYTRAGRPYRAADLAADGITINDIDVDRLLTHIEWHDADMVNLVDTQLLQSNANNLFGMTKRVLVRQQRIGHRPFTIGYDIASDRVQTVVVRTWLGSAVAGGVQENRRSFILLDAFVESLQPGTNIIRRDSIDFAGTALTRDVSTLREIYRRIMTGPHSESAGGPTGCRLPHRLLLPRGISDSMPVQIVVVVSPAQLTEAQWPRPGVSTGICGLGTAEIGLDNRPLGFPFNRNIEDFDVPNVLVKRDIIQHVAHATMQP